MKLVVAKIRKEKGMTQNDLAEKLGLTSQAICNYEKGIREPNLATLRNMSTVLECTVDELLEDDDDEGRA
jgi:transcriptional regulator with XRE-family HTH domain